ncbi:aspartyl-tRNA synthetase [Fusarium oxysporum f. sp. radicis-lycopersici 26381]|nr:aspartyl-tRNA synthetase [Fusarium oxysporum f. sp. radicis-lycopersici 26381]
MTVGTEITFRAKIQTQQRLSPDRDSLIFRDQTGSIQGALARTTPHLINLVKCLTPESLVQVTGTLQQLHEPIPFVSNYGLEVTVYSVHPVDVSHSRLFDNYGTPESPQEPTRILDLRHPSNKALFRIRAIILRTFRQVLEDQGFIEIHTPRLQPAAIQSGSEMFEVSYYSRRAVLAQSQQLANQMAIAAGFRRVYEIGPIFRATNSEPQDLAECTSLDVGMTLGQSYNDLVQTVDDALKHVFATVQSMPELQVVRDWWPSKDVFWLDKTPIIPFTEALQMLRNDGRDIEGEDLPTRDEVRLGELVKQKYMTDYYILDKPPAHTRSFYTHRAEGTQWANPFNIFLRGHWICTGGQRINDEQNIQKSIEHAQITEDDKQDYITGLDLVAPPHGGASLGLEHLIATLLELGDVRYASLFHRDGKSLSGRSPSLLH